MSDLEIRKSYKMIGKGKLKFVGYDVTMTDEEDNQPFQEIWQFSEFVSNEMLNPLKKASSLTSSTLNDELLICINLLNNGGPIADYFNQMIKNKKSSFIIQLDGGSTMIDLMSLNAYRIRLNAEVERQDMEASTAAVKQIPKKTGMRL